MYVYVYIYAYAGVHMYISYGLSHAFVYAISELRFLLQGTGDGPEHLLQVIAGSACVPQAE